LAQRQVWKEFMDRYRTLADLPEDVPVFPLRGVILLPRATLPLNIFEPRYLQMLDDMLRGRRLVAVIQPDQSQASDKSDTKNAEASADDKSVPVRTMGCLGRLTAFQELDDGRMIVSLTGIARCEVVREIRTEHPYRTFRMRYGQFASDLIAGAGEDAVDREALLKALKAYLEARQLNADWPAISRSSSETLINSLSIISPYGPEEKQALLEAPDLKTRADVLVALAEMEIAAGSTGAGSTLQ
jgi:uncharacterized protein